MEKWYSLMEKCVLQPPPAYSNLVSILREHLARISEVIAAYAWMILSERKATRNTKLLNDKILT